MIRPTATQFQSAANGTPLGRLITSSGLFTRRWYRISPARHGSRHQIPRSGERVLSTQSFMQRRDCSAFFPSLSSENPVKHFRCTYPLRQEEFRPNRYGRKPTCDGRARTRFRTSKGAFNRKRDPLLFAYDRRSAEPRNQQNVEHTQASTHLVAPCAA